MMKEDKFNDDPFNIDWFSNNLGVDKADIESFKGTEIKFKNGCEQQARNLQSKLEIIKCSYHYWDFSNTVELNPHHKEDLLHFANSLRFKSQALNLQFRIFENSQVSYQNNIPKVIHFTWLGGKIPHLYAYNIQRIANLASKNGFKIMLWVDKFTDSLPKDEIESFPEITVKKVSDLLGASSKDSFYCGKNKKRFLSFSSIILREGIGLDNQAAKSDLLRLEILRQFGGYYLDVDLVLKNDIQSMHLAVDKPKYNFLMCGHYSGVSNDMMCSIPNHKILKIAITKVVKKINELEKEPFWETLATKRFENDKEGLRKSKRSTLILEISGPGLVWKSIVDYCNLLNISPAGKFIFPFDECLISKAIKVTVAGMIIEARSDQSWRQFTLDIKNVVSDPHFYGFLYGAQIHNWRKNFGKDVKKLLLIYDNKIDRWYFCGIDATRTVVEGYVDKLKIFKLLPMELLSTKSKAIENKKYILDFIIDKLGFAKVDYKKETSFECHF